MDKARWRRIRQSFLHLSDQSPSFRNDYLNMIAEDDAGLRDDIEAMLAAHDRLESGAERSLPANPPDDALIGTRLNGYEIIDRIGSGGMSVVYRARRPGKADVAIKSLPRYLVRHPAARARLEREAEILDAISHPALCAVHDVLHADALLAIVMDFVDGQNLETALGGGALPLPRALAVAADIAGALALAHQQGIVHRDIKPSNVLLTADGAVKLIDFGIAHFSHARMTYTGELLGSPAYMAPEQWSADPIDGRTDIWALGALLYLMCSGAAPFRGDSVADCAQRVRHAPPAPWPPHLCSDKPLLETRALTLRMLAKDPARRPAAMETVLAELTTLRDAVQARIISNVSQQ